MISPYVNTILYSNVTLYPHQMNNDIYQSLKLNLIEELKDRCFGDYGYIVDIFEILTYNINRIEAENTMGSAIYDVKFSCRLCRPINETTIVCKVDKINKMLIRCVNGPINLIVTTERINTDVFYRDNNRNLRFKSGETSTLLTSNHYVKVAIIKTSFLNRDTRVIGIGFLQDVASPKEIESFFKDQYDSKGKLIPFEEYMKNLQEKQQEEIPKDAEELENERD